MKKKDTKNFIWNSIGSLVFGFTSLLYMIFITRINGVDESGIFTYAFAVASILWTIGNYSGKTYQVTENNKKINDTDYLYNRAFTCFIMIICSFIFCIITRPSLITIEMIILLTLYRSIDCIIECIHAIVQRNGELYKVGISLFVRTIILTISFLIIDKIANNMVIASLFLVIINILYCFLVDYSLIKGKYTKEKFNKEKNKTLLKAGFATFCYSFLSIYLINASKYAMNSFTTDELQAIFGIIIMPASFLSMIATYIVQPFLNAITEKVKNNKMKDLRTLLYRLSLAIIIIGLLAIVVCYFIGIPVLELVYGIELNNELTNLIIILIGSILYSLSILSSSIFIAMRKTFTQLVLLIITSLTSLIICYYLVKNYGIKGAAISYTLIMGLEAVLHFIVLLYITKERKKTITIRLMGGLGNQMFEYSILRTMMLENNIDGIISLKGITNKTHNIYSLDHFNISNDIKITYKESIKSKINYLIYGFYCVFLVKRKNGFKIIKNIQSTLNYLGMYCVPDGYIKLNSSDKVNQVMVGYYQSSKYFDKYKDIIKEELKVKDKILSKNKKLLKDIETNNSICLHIRRGDFIFSNHEVCNKEYYFKAIKEIKKHVKQPKFFIFSDDINWVKENIEINEEVVYIEGNNPNYEELRLMYSCKHFIISNSSFSFWAQYLSDNKNKITIAPSKWFLNPNQRVDIYEDDWIIIDV